MAVSGRIVRRARPPKVDLDTLARREASRLGTEHYHGEPSYMLSRLAESKARGEALAKERRDATRGRDAAVMSDVKRYALSSRDGQYIATPTPEREAKGDFAFDEVTDGQRVQAVVCDFGSTAIQRLHNSGKIDDDQARAASKYWRQVRSAGEGMGKCAWVDDRVQGGGGEGGDAAERRVVARHLLGNARAVIRAVHRDALKVTDAFVVSGETAAEAALQIGNSKGPRAEARALTILETSLNALARHYGIVRA